MILFVIFVKQRLHKPMYYFLSMLSAADLCQPSRPLPLCLGFSGFMPRKSGVKACLIQMFFVHTFSFLESSVLAIMAFDRFMAICSPLKCHYPQGHDDFGDRTIHLRTTTNLSLSHASSLEDYIFPGKKGAFPSILSYPDIIRDTYSNPWINSFLGLFLQLYMTGTDLMFILVSYVLIIRAVLRHRGP